ncbi:purine and uridine phosphorylase [Aspergillus californicus]
MKEIQIMATSKTLSHDDYTVGWICALPLEMAAAQAHLDEIHADLPVPPHDHNAYTLGSVGKHNIVIACLPAGEYGIASATTVSTQLLSSFRSIRLGLMVGIGGAVPNDEVDIRLGDIVVSKPTSTHGGVIQYNYGKALNGSAFQRTGMLNRPPQLLLTAVSKLQANHLTGSQKFIGYLEELGEKLPRQASYFARPDQPDHLYLAEYAHAKPSKTCRDCDATKTVPRLPRYSNDPVAHYGLIASADQVVKDSQLRDRQGQELGVYCVDMEAAGLMNNYPCLVIRGICDYADSHKNKDWQGYAAAVAAAYAKELLSVTSVSHVDQIGTVRETISYTGIPPLKARRSSPQLHTSTSILPSEFSGINLGTIPGDEIIPYLMQNPEPWRKEIHELLGKLRATHPQWWVERRSETAELMNEFFARHKLTFRVNLVQKRTPRPLYAGDYSEYLNALFFHNSGWCNGWENAGVPEINIAIWNLWAILEFLDRKGGRKDNLVARAYYDVLKY